MRSVYKIDQPLKNLKQYQEWFGGGSSSVPSTGLEASAQLTPSVQSLTQQNNADIVQTQADNPAPADVGRKR